MLSAKAGILCGVDLPSFILMDSKVTFRLRPAKVWVSVFDCRGLKSDE